MRYSVLGPVEIETADGERHTIGSANQRAILAMLLARHGTIVSTDELIDGIWGDDPPASAIQSLRTYVSRLRKMVGDRLVAHDDGYALDCATDDVDARAFEDEIAQGRYSDALQRWRGRPFGDMGDLPVTRSETLRLETLARSARTGQLEELLVQGRVTDAVSCAEAIVFDDPLDETAWAALVRALARSGRTADALRAYQRAANELAGAGLEPGAFLKEAESDALSGAPPPDTSARRRAPPRPLTAFVGRQAEIERLVELTASRRVVTIVGPGGVGKTRLSVEVAREAAGHYELGARFVELARVVEPEAIRTTIRRALDLGEQHSDLTKGLGAVDALVILDNCEHVIDAVAEELPALLSGGERLRVLATSREPLGVAGEHRWMLAPLSTIGPAAPALALFVDRAREVGVEVDPDESLAQAVVALLDGLPLAVEMAAVRLATMGLADLAEELERSFASLDAGRRGAEERHSTLRAVLAWSEALLTPGQRNVLADFSIFAGSVEAGDLPAAIAAENPLGEVCALAERSLITVDTTDQPHARYGSLATVRQFGRERLRSLGRFDEVSRRHAEWFTTVAEDAAVRFQTIDEADAVARIDSTIDELRAAHRWSRAHDPVLALRLSHALFEPALQGLRVEIFDWSIALAEGIDVDDERVARLYGEIASGLTLLGRLGEARQWAGRSIVRASDAAGSRAAYSALSDIALYNGDLEASAQFGRRHIDLAREVGTPIEQAYGAANVALALAYVGQREKALAQLPPSAAPETAPTARGWLAYARGEVLLEIEPIEALREIDDAIALAESVGNHFLGGVAHVSAVSLRARSGDPHQAIRPMAATIARFADRGDATHLLTTLRNLPTLLVRLEQWRHAAVMLGGLSAVSLSPTYGAEADRLADAEATTRSKLGDDDFGGAYRQGAEHSLEQAAYHAIAVLDDLAGAENHMTRSLAEVRDVRPAGQPSDLRRSP